jgi:hypothetical protein
MVTSLPQERCVVVVFAWCPQLKVFCNLPKETIDFLYWEANQLDVLEQHPANAVED